MNSSWMFIIKLLILSGILSAIIKYVIPFIHLPATATVVWLLVLTPPIAVAIALWVRSQQFRQFKATRPETSK